MEATEPPSSGNALATGGSGGDNGCLTWGEVVGGRYALLAACLLGGCADDTSDDTRGARPVAWLTEVTEAAGLDFVHHTGATGRLLLPEIMGGGAALFDYDGDGDLDIYLIDGDGSNRLYRQEPGGRFADVTVSSGLGDRGFGMGAAVGDVDNDGHPDVYVTNHGPDALYRNLGDGTFADVTRAAGIDVDGWSCSASFFDYDADGFLDLFVTRYVRFDPTVRCFDRAGRPEYCGPTSFEPVHDILLHNNGDGTFTDASAAAGIAAVAAAGLGVVCEDLDDDGRIDVYVANDAYANHLWINAGDGTFRDEAVVRGAAYNLHGTPEAGMGVIAADLDNDERLDLFVTHLSYETNTFYRGLGPGSGFIDATGPANLGSSSMRYTGFGTAAFDIDQDGDLDLAVVNGRVNRLEPLPGAGVEPPWDRLAEPNLLYLNDGAGRFEPAARRAGAFGAPIEISRALATGDIDGDGDIDLLVANVAGPARLYRNDAPRLGNWLVVRAVDPDLNRDAIGARVTVTGPARRQTATIRAGSGYLTSCCPSACFGLGPARRVADIRVRWPDGLTESFGPAETDQLVVLARTSSGVPR